MRLIRCCCVKHDTTENRFERPRTEPIPDGHTVVAEGQASILSLLARDNGDYPTQPLPQVVPSAAPLPPTRAPLMTFGQQWRIRNSQRPGRPDWYQR